MFKHKCHLIAAIAFTVSAAAWLINCALDVVLSIPGSLGRDALLTLLWSVAATCWWLRWQRFRSAAE